MLLPSGELWPQVSLHASGGGYLLCSSRSPLLCHLYVTSAGVVGATIFKRTRHRQGLHAIACGGSPCESAADFKGEGGVVSLRESNRDGKEGQSWGPEAK